MVASDLLYSDTLLPVRELPVVPLANAHYVFDDIPREEVTEFNHGLHKYPAKFIPQLPRWALDYKKAADVESVVDISGPWLRTLEDSDREPSGLPSAEGSILACLEGPDWALLDSLPEPGVVYAGRGSYERCG